MSKTLKNLYQEHQGKVSDKWELYLSEYHRLFCDLRNREISLLEIGVQNGGSLEIWASYFAQANKLIGCDIDPKCHRLIYNDPRIKIVIGDANLDSTQLAILSYANCYDLIIDDGSHHSADIIKSFTRYFPHLADGGLFIVEDLHCSYWQEFEGGLFNPFSSIAFFKRLVDILNHEQWGISQSRTDFLASFSSHYELVFDEVVLAHIHSIEFVNSVCVIRKSNPEDNLLGCRVIVGQDEIVQSDVKIFNSSTAIALNQSTNISSLQQLPSEETFLQQLNFLNKNKIQIASLNQSLEERGQDLVGSNAKIAALSQSLEGQKQELLNCNIKIASFSQSLEQQREELVDYSIQVANLEGQLNILNIELFRLLAESANVNSKIDKRILCLCNRILPLRSRRRTIVVISEKLILKLLVKLQKNALSAYRNLSLKFKSVFSHKEDINKINLSKEEIQADHPQLETWIAKHEPTEDQLATQRTDANQFNYKPLLSVIIPVYQVPQFVLIETLNCLVEQTYSNWEACIVWADSEDLAGWEWLQENTKADKRFKIKRLDKNGGISLNSNKALQLAAGEYIALLDHDDTLAPWAFYEVVKLLQSSPELDFIYSDKDSISADGQIHMNALFKPKWSPEMLHSVNYLTHLNIMRTRLVREIGGWNSEMDGAQDWDIFFRITEKTQHIARLPFLLYHWRILPTSTATGMAAKPYAAMSQLKAQQGYFKRKRLAAAVLPTAEGLFHVKWPLMPASADVIVYQTGSLAQLVSVLDALRAGSQDVIRNIYVLHDTSSELLQAFLQVWGNRCILVQHKAINWRIALMVAAKLKDNQTVVFIDGSAASISQNLVQELAGWVAQHPNIAWASAIALNPDNTVYEAGRVVTKDYQSAPMFHGNALFSFGWFGGPLWYRNARAASPYAIAMNTNEIKKVLSDLNEKKGQEYSFSEFCLALTSNERRGLINPFAKVYFNESPESQWKNNGRLYHEDPYFHPAFDQVNPLRLHS